MRIDNYNSTKHDIYTFDETYLRLISWGFGSGPIIPCVTTEYSSYVNSSGQTIPIPPGGPLPAGFTFRQHAPVIGYNSGMVSFLQSKGVDVPDFSGLHVRNRGSNLNRFAFRSDSGFIQGEPFWILADNGNIQNPTNGMYAENPIFNPLDHNNWNNGVPPFCMVSPKHFLGCNHFVGPENNTNQTIRLLKKNGDIVNREGQFISRYEDANLYRLLIPLTEEEQQQINCYDIVDFRTIPPEVKIWRQDSNGKYLVYTVTQGSSYYSSSGFSGYSPILYRPYQDHSGEFPVPWNPPNTPSWYSGLGFVWNGDSGSPLLLTANGKTYLYGFSNGIIDSFAKNTPQTDWLLGALEQDGVVKKLVNAEEGGQLIKLPTAYKAGFLEEAESSGLPFIVKNPNGNPAIVSVKLSGEYNVYPGEQVYLNDIEISSIFNTSIDTSSTEEGLVFYILTCNVYAGDRLLISKSDFQSSGAYTAKIVNIGKYNHLQLNIDEGRLALTIVFLSVPTLVDFSPTDNFPLSPFCLEPYTGQVSLNLQDRNISTGLLTFSSGYNYQLDYKSENFTAVNFAVSIGAGEGLQPCEDLIDVPGYLRSINGVSPNDRGDIKLQAPSEDCVSVDTGYSATSGGKIKLDSHCAPCCRCTDYENSSDYIKGVAVKYSELVKQYNALVSIYNNVQTNFEDSLRSCPTQGKLNSRFRMWPQQNFKVQVQAMVENNTNTPTIIKKLKLELSLSLYNPISAVDPETNATYQMDENDSVAAVPLEDASYLYYKNLNPVSQGFTFSVPNSGSLKFEADLTQSGMPVPGGPPGQSPYITPPCSGYAMITGGFVIVDPLFRKIVSLNYRSGLNIKLNILFKYTGTAQDEDPCNNPDEAEHLLVPAGGVEKSITIRPNKSSVNPCDSIQPSTIAQSVNEENNILFNLNLPQVTYGTGQVTITYKSLTDAGWQEFSSSTVNISTGNAGTQTISLGGLPENLGSGNHQVLISYVPEAGARLYTKCVRSDDSNDVAEIPVAPFQVGKAFNL